jgi:hypothetical protein
MDTLKPAVFAIAAALASASGTMPDVYARVDTTIGSEDAESQEKAVEKFLTESKRYLGL